MAKSKKARASQEVDGVYVLKIVMYMIVGAQWFWLVDAELIRQWPLPVGMVVGALFARHEHFQIDRKIEYALLLVAGLVGFWSQTGIFLTVL